MFEKDLDRTRRTESGYRRYARSHFLHSPRLIIDFLNCLLCLEVLKKLLSDPDEKVRLAACQIFEEIDYETACHHVSRRSLEVLGERTVDRKVRFILARLYRLISSDSDLVST